MTTPQTSYVKPKQLRYKPLVFIVQSPHHTMIRARDLTTSLEELDGVTYTRSLFVAHLAEVFGLRGPTYIYFDGWFQSDAEQYNEFLRSQVGYNRGRLQEIREQAKPAGRRSRRAVKQILEIPSQEWYIQTLLKDNRNRFRFSNRNLEARIVGRELFKGLSHISPRNGVDLVQFEEERLASMLSYPVVKGADATLRPGDYDPDLFRRWLLEEAQGDISFRPEFNIERDNNLYTHVAEDFKGGGVKFGIIYFGSDHVMRRFRETNDFDVFWATLENVMGLISFDAIIPGTPEKTDLDRLQEAYTILLEGEKTRVHVNLKVRPRQLM